MGEVSFFRYKIKIEFQDILALIIIIPFLIFSIKSAFGNGDLEILRIYIPLVTTVLAGYFGQGAVREWKRDDSNESEEKI